MKTKHFLFIARVKEMKFTTFHLFMCSFLRNIFFFNTNDPNTHGIWEGEKKNRVTHSQSFANSVCLNQSQLKKNANWTTV